jgi:hypothetical protein
MHPGLFFSLLVNQQLSHLFHSLYGVYINEKLKLQVCESIPPVYVDFIWNMLNSKNEIILLQIQNARKCLYGTRDFFKCLGTPSPFSSELTPNAATQPRGGRLAPRRSVPAIFNTDRHYCLRQR